MKLESLDFDKLKYTENLLSNHNKSSGTFYKMINYNLDNLELEFQTPKIIIKEIVKEYNKEYLLLQFIHNKHSKSFYEKIIELEQIHQKNIKSTDLKSLIDQDTITVKVPIRYSKPCLKIIKDSELFNYYHLKPGMKIICKLSGNNIWFNELHVPSYNLIVKEILIL